MDSKQCNLCGSQMDFKEGISRTKNKPFRGYFCQNKDCGNVEWLRTLGTSPKPQNIPPTSVSTPRQPQPQDGIKMLTAEVVELIGVVRELIGLMKDNLGIQE